jgi:hypothetical protein
MTVAASERRQLSSYIPVTRLLAPGPVTQAIGRTQLAITDDGH